MSDSVYSEHGIFIRRVTLDLGGGPGYTFYAPSLPVKLTRYEFRKLVLKLVDHLMKEVA